MDPACSAPAARGLPGCGDAGLPLDPDGRIRTDRCLLVEGHPSLFASGDCGVIRADPRPAVRGMGGAMRRTTLAINLEAA